MLNAMTLQLVFLLLASWAQAKEICERRYIFSFSNTPPSFFVDSNGEKRGNSYLILKEIIKNLECKDSEKPGSFQHNREDFRRNQVDIYGLTTPDTSLDSYGEFVELYRQTRILVINKKFNRDKLTISDYIKEPQITFGTVIGIDFFILPDEKDYLFKRARLLELPTPPDVFHALLTGRIQAAFSSPIFNYHFLYKSGKINDFNLIADPVNKSRIGMYLSKRRLNPLERARIKKVIKQMKLNGSIERLAKKSIRPEDFKYYELPPLTDP